MTSNEQEIKTNLDMLHSADFEVQLLAIRNLGVIGDASTITRFLELLEDQSLVEKSFKYLIYSEVIFNLPFLLKEFPNQAAEDKIIQILVDKSEENESYRALCAEVLGRLKSKRALPVLIKLLDNAPPKVQESVAYALGLIGNNEALPELRNLISRESLLMENPKVIKEAKEAIQVIEGA